MALLGDGDHQLEPDLDKLLFELVSQRCQLSHLLSVLLQGFEARLEGFAGSSRGRCGSSCLDLGVCGARS